MLYFNIICFIISINLFIRYASFAVTQWYLYSFRDAECIERVKRKQKYSDIMVANYNTISAITHMFASVSFIAHAFNLHLDGRNVIVIAAIFIALILCYICSEYYIKHKKGVTAFYNMMIEYKHNEEVVTKDNDHEVNFIQTYDKTKLNSLWSVIWIVYLIILCVYNNIA